MQKFDLKLLTFTVLLGAVNIESSYSMENIHEISNKIQKENNEINEKLNTNVYCEKICNEYESVKNNNNKNELDNIVKTFCNTLFKNDMKYLKDVLRDNIKSELSAICNMLSQDDVRNHLIKLLNKQKNLGNNILQVLNNIKNNTTKNDEILLMLKNSKKSNYNIDDVNNIIDYLIRQIVNFRIRKELKTNFDLDTLYYNYQNAKCNKVDDNDWKIQMESFYQYLLGGDNCQNLQKILNNEIKLDNNSYFTICKNISCMLEDNNVNEYLIGLLRKNDNLYKQISTILMNITYPNLKALHYNFFYKIVWKIKDCLSICELRQKLKGPSIKEIYDNYQKANKDDKKIQIKSLIQYLSDNLETIFHHKDNIGHDLGMIGRILLNEDVRKEVSRAVLSEPKLSSIINTEPDKNNDNAIIIGFLQQQIRAYVRQEENKKTRISFQEIYDNLKSKSKTTPKKSAVYITKNFVEVLFGGNNSENLKNLFDCKNEQELESVYYMLSMTEVQKCVTEFLNNHSDILDNIFTICCKYTESDNNQETYQNKIIQCIQGLV